MKGGEMIPICLTVAGSDCSAGAGIQADLKTFAANGCYGTSVITAVTVQNTLGVHAVYPVDASVVGEQIDAILNDMPIAAVKIGMLGDSDIAAAVAGRLGPANIPLVIDPVLKATSGTSLLDADFSAGILERFYPFCTLLTPNLHEARQLTGVTHNGRSDRQQLAEKFFDKGLEAVLITGGDLPGDIKQDRLFRKEEDRIRSWEFRNASIPSPNSHGTGCTLSSAITSLMARGVPLARAVELGIAYVNRCLRASVAFRTGKGTGGLDHFSYFRTLLT